NRARYYDPVMSRWIGQDPLGYAAGDSNLYRYAHNEAPNATDPTGFDPPGDNSLTGPAGPPPTTKPAPIKPDPSNSINGPLPNYKKLTRDEWREILSPSVNVTYPQVYSPEWGDAHIYVKPLTWDNLPDALKKE